MTLVKQLQFIARNSIKRPRQLISRLMADTCKLPFQKGSLVGRTEDLPSHGNYQIFQGIPYAKAPQRFQPAHLHEIKSQIDCTREGQVGYQPDLLTKIPIGGEDCLYLNVYTPDVTTKKSLPVMVFIHGGAFLMESGGTEWRSPEYLVQEGVIVVTFNYRLSFLGFMHLPAAGIHGNQGLRDQRLALKWVQENIDKFGGDPNNVTAFGHSAAAAAVQTHALLPESKKYFHKAILQSGSATMDWFIQHNPEEKARKLAKLCGCKATDDKEIGDFLRKAPLFKMLLHLMSTMRPSEKKRGLPIIFKPVIEQPGPQAFLTEDIGDMLREKNRLDIPMIMGVTEKDGMIMVHGQRSKLEAWDTEPGRWIPRTVDINGDDDELCRPLGDQIRKFYLGNEPTAKDPFTNFLDFHTDYHFNIPIQGAAELHSRFQHPTSELYYFQFSYDGELNMMKKMFEFDYPGANHGDDMTYLFVMKSNEIKVDPNSEAAKMRQKMCKMWTDFAKFGNPTPDTNEWKPVKKHHRDEDNFELDCFDINKECRMIKNPAKERIDFWRSIYKHYNGSFLKPKL